MASPASLTRVAQGSGRCGASPELERVITRGPSGSSAARWKAWPPGSMRLGWPSDAPRTAGSPTMVFVGIYHQRGDLLTMQSERY